MLARSSIGLAGAIGGATVVCATALVFGPPGSAVGALDALQGRLVSVRTSGPPNAAVLAPAAFTLFGRGAAPTLRLDGVAISPARRAALISVGGGAADWLEVGAGRDGVTLVEVQPGQAVFETDAGSKTVKLGDGAPPSAAVNPSPGAAPQARPQGSPLQAPGAIAGFGAPPGPRP